MNPLMMGMPMTGMGGMNPLMNSMFRPNPNFAGAGAFAAPPSAFGMPSSTTNNE
jgi:hypothetical protein